MEVVEVLNIDFVWLPHKASLYLKSQQELLYCGVACDMNTSWVQSMIQMEKLTRTMMRHQTAMTSPLSELIRAKRSYYYYNLYPLPPHQLLQLCHCH